MPEPVSGFVVLAYGSVKITMPRTNGNQRVVRLMRARDRFGAAAVLQGQPEPRERV